MASNEIVAKINDVVADVLEIDIAAIQPRRPVAEYIDSLDVIQIADGVEGAFPGRFRLDDGQLGDVKTLEDFYSLVEELLAA